MQASTAVSGTDAHHRGAPRVEVDVKFLARRPGASSQAPALSQGSGAAQDEAAYNATHSQLPMRHRLAGLTKQVVLQFLPLEPSARPRKSPSITATCWPVALRGEFSSWFRTRG